MAKKIFRSIILVSFAVLLTSIVLIMGVMYGYFTRISEGQLKTELEKARTDYAQQSAERKALKKEADRLSRLAQQKRDSQRTLARYMENEQAAKRKKSQLE